jgi:endo-1,4-beta-mannosidase
MRDEEITALISAHGDGLKAHVVVVVVDQNNCKCDVYIGRLRQYLVMNQLKLVKKDWPLSKVSGAVAGSNCLAGQKARTATPA